MNFPAMSQNMYFRRMMKEGFLLGLDIGSSSIKASLVDVRTGKAVASAQSPDAEMPILALKPGWAEQDPELWWKHVVESTRRCLRETSINPAAVLAIGIAYQMHGLVMIGKDLKPLRPSIIWCDSRAVTVGEKAFSKLGEEFCLSHLLNSPGNFTASKLRWVNENEPAIFRQLHKFMLPGDYIALKLTGEIQTTQTGLSEGILWDFKKKSISKELLEEYEIDKSAVPEIVPVFSDQGKLNQRAASELGLNAGVSIAYRAGDQPNNAFSLNVLQPGETAATAGTSGVIYGVTDQHSFDPQSRVNTFVHVTNGKEIRNGILLCVNGTGILNSWLNKNINSFDKPLGYVKMNELAGTVAVGSDGLVALPFGNGAERILGNRETGAGFHGLDFNHHTRNHLFRAAQEGIVFSLKYGLDILEKMGSHPTVIRAGKANMFLSPVFREAFANTTGARLELYDTNGAQGAALGAGVGAGIYSTFAEAFNGLTMIDSLDPDREKTERYAQAYRRWNEVLNLILSK